MNKIKKKHNDNYSPFDWNLVRFYFININFIFWYCIFLVSFQIYQLYLKIKNEKRIEVSTKRSKTRR